MTPVRLLESLQRRVRLVVTRGVVRAVDDALKHQGLQLVVLADEVAKVEHFQQYGFTSVPPVGSEALVFAVGGSRSHLVALAAGHRDQRLRNLAAGDVAVFHPDGGRVHLQAGKRLDAVGDDVRLGSADASDAVALSSRVLAELQALRAALNALITLFNAHVHPSAVGPTGPTPTPATAAAEPSSVGASKVKAI